MSEPSKLPPEQVAALAERLQGALKRRRPRTWVIVFCAVVVACGGLALLAWWLRERPAPPRLEVILFDDMTAPGQTPHIVAQLAFAEPGTHSPSLLAGRELLFFPAPAQLQPVNPEPQARAATDAHGRAVVEWTAPRAAQAETIVARYVNIASKQASNDQASLVTWEPGSKVLVVDVEETLVRAEPPQWLSSPPAGIATRPGAAGALQQAQRQGYHVAYLAVRPSKVEVYPRVRAWIHLSRTEKERFPPGPVLGRRDYTVDAEPAEVRRERLSALESRLGDSITFITRTAIVPGVRTIVLDAKAGPPGTLRATTWAGVATLLDTPKK